MAQVARVVSQEAEVEWERAADDLEWRRQQDEAADARAERYRYSSGSEGGDTE